MKYIFLLGLVLLPAIILTFDNGSRFLVSAEDEIEDDETVDVEGEGEETAASEDRSDTGEDEEEDDGKLKPSPNADAMLLFTKPVSAAPGTNKELVAGSLVEFLVGFANRGPDDFTVETLDASFRYPMDFTFYIQNFSTITYNRLVKPSQEATLMYSFIPAESFAGRPFGLNINLRYRDTAGTLFEEAVFNETVQIIELEEGLDGETFFLYVFLAACIVLLLVLGQQFLYSVGKKRVGKKPVVERGTSNPNDVDYDWVPKEMLHSLNKSPRAPKQSPRQRKAKRTHGFDN